MMDTPGSVADGQWHHVVLGVSGTAQTMYLDGNAVGSASGATVSIGAKYATIGAGFFNQFWPDQPLTSLGVAGYFKGTIGEVASFDRSLSPVDVKTIYNASAPTSVLASVVRPSGNPTVVVAYNSASGAVTQVTDTNGGVWKLAAPTISGSYQVYSGAVMAKDPADYWRLAESGTTTAINQVNGGAATYSNVTLGTAGGPFDDPARNDDDTTVASFNGTSSYVQMPNADVPNDRPELDHDVVQDGGGQYGRCAVQLPVRADRRT